MMCLIRIVDGKPFEHPILTDNYLQVYPDTDLDNLPEGLAWFERKLRPELPEGYVFVSENSVYEFDGNVWTDVWKIRELTAEEIAKYQQDEIQFFNKLVSNKKEKAVADLQECTNEAGIATLNEYLSLLNTLVFTTYKDLESVRIPPYPKKLEDGSYATINASGSAPNVIG